MLFGEHQYADILLAVLGLSRAECGRYRDCRPSEDGTQIIIHTRNGGNNRAYCWPHELQKHPCYLSDADDDFDNTYADILFRVPDGCEEMIKRIADQSDTRPPSEQWRLLLDSLRAGNDNALASRALEVGAKIFTAIEKGGSQTAGNESGSVLIAGNLKNT